jgi:hypothetical protein
MYRNSSDLGAKGCTAEQKVVLYGVQNSLDIQHWNYLKRTESHSTGPVVVQMTTSDNKSNMR